MKHPLLLLCAIAFGTFVLTQPTASAAEAKSSVVDYFLLLPPDTFEGPAADWLKFLRQPGCGLVDTKNGYIKCTGDGAQPSFEIALFRYQDGRPLLALCGGELEGDDSVYLSFYQLGTDGRMHPAPSSLFPIKDAPKTLRFTLPREGRTLVVRDAKSGKVKARFTWDGAKFQPEK